MSCSQLRLLRSPSEKYENAIVRQLLRIALVGVLIVLMAVGARVGFVAWNHHRLFRRGLAALNTGDFAGAEQFAAQLIASDSNIYSGRWLMAATAEKKGSRSAVTKWGRVVALRPGREDEAYNWARVALQFNDSAAAEIALGSVPEPKRKSAQYELLAGRLALLRKDPAGGQTHFLKALGFEPDNLQGRLELARVNMGSADAATRAQARKVLTELRGNRELRRDALRSLLNEARQAKDWPRATELAGELRSLPEALFGDRLLYLETLHSAKDPRFGSYLAQLQKEARDPQKATAAAELVASMSEMGAAEDALTWMTTLPHDRVAEVALQVAIADAHVTLGRWKALQERVQVENWQTDDPLRQIYLARAAREQGDDLGYRAAWVKALPARAPNPTVFARIASTLLKWGWEREAVEAYLRLAEDPDNSEWALLTLANHYLTAGDSPGLLSVSLRLAREKPEDLALQNNIAQLSLLLGINIDTAKRQAQALYTREPQNPACASTYAFALYRSGQFSKALIVMQSLGDERLHEASTAAYYGLILAAAGKSTRAEEFLDLGLRGQLLPEERDLATKAKNALHP